MKGILVAAGLGEQVARRAWRASLLFPPRPPIDQAIDSFARAGFEEVGVVVGHNEDVLWHYLEDGARYGIVVHCLQNTQHARGRATALCAARPFVGGEPFVVSLCDHPVTPAMLLSLRSRAAGAHAVCVERRGRSQRDRHRTKVWLDAQGRVLRISRRLKHWHALSTGTFLFQPGVFSHVSELVLRSHGDCSMEALLRRMIACGEAFYACEIAPQWERAQGRDDLLLWTAPMLSVTSAPQLRVA